MNYHPNKLPMKNYSKDENVLYQSHLFPLPCGAGSTVPREGFDSSVIMPFSWCAVAVTLPI